MELGRVSRFLRLAFVVISFSLRPQTEEVHVLLKADRLKRTAGEARPAN
jgi:hypothetical protein